MNTRYAFLFLSLLFSISAYSQLTVENENSVSYYIQEVFLGQGLTVDNITFNGLPGDSVQSQVGSFVSNGSYIDIFSGLVMSTGGVSGESVEGGTVIVGELTTIPVNATSLNTDSDLELITGGVNVNDVALIEFDIVPQFGFLLYDYQFGSEEYPEYVGSFNDAFGFFLSGPGIDGTYSSPEGSPGGAINIALLPNTDIPVSINTVNNGNEQCPGPLVGPCTNCEYYIDNCPIENALDGMTTSMMASAEVQVGETYHIKLAIGDAMDGAFDSAIFLKEFSLRSAAQLPTSTVEYEASAILLAQNPMVDFLVLDNIPETMTSFELLDIQGRVAVSTTAITDPSMRTDISNLDGGIYILLVTEETGKVWSQKVVKE